MIATAIGLIFFFVLQVVLGLVVLFEHKMTDRMLIGMVMLYVWLAGFVIGTLLS